MKALVLAVIVALAAGLLPLAATAEAQATRIEFTGTQTCGAGSPGEVTFPDGNIHIRRATVMCDTVTTLPDGHSTAYSVSNMNLDATGSGPVWGTSRNERDGVVTFEGSFTGTMTGLTAWTVRVVSQGRGALEGAKLFATVECHFVPGGSVCDLSGYLLVP